MSDAPDPKTCDKWGDLPRPPREFFHFSFLLAVTQCFVRLIWFLSLVEWVKFAALARGARLGRGEEECALTRSWAIDSYELGKWGILIAAFLFTSPDPGWIAPLIVSYLLWSNLFSHFYYHVWQIKTESANPDGKNAPTIPRRRNRRMNSFIGALAFMFAGYAYLYRYHLAYHLTWPENEISVFNAFFLSIANSFTLTYGGYGPCDGIARFVFASQVLYTFVFVGVIIARSIPDSEH